MFASGKKGDRFVFRGELAEADFTTEDFTTDGVWHDLDLSGIVPKNATLVLLGVEMKLDTTGKNFGVIKKGIVNDIAKDWLTSQAANVFIRDTLTASIDKNGFIKYYGSNYTFTSLYMSVRGWFV